MLAPSHYSHNEIVTLDRAYINYAKFENLTERDVVYVTKMKKRLNYEVLVDCIHQNPKGLMEHREQVVVFRKDVTSHIARIITYIDIKKGKTPKLILVIDKRLRYADRNNRGNIPSSLADRVALQADKAELPPKILLWGECQCHKDTDMGDTHRESVTLGLADLLETALELFRTGYYSAYCIDVLP